MKRLFNKTFFKFTVGFILIIAIALLAIMITGGFEFNESVDTLTENQQLIVK
jgi:predicted transcriptional regulator